MVWHSGGALLTDTSLCGARFSKMKMCLPLFKNYKELREGENRALDPARALLSMGTAHMPTEPAGHQPALALPRGAVGSRGPERPFATGSNLAAGRRCCWAEPCPLPAPLTKNSAHHSLPTLAPQGPFPHHD